MRLGDVRYGALVQLRDGTFGVLSRTTSSGGGGVPVDLWHAPAALIPPDEEVHVVDNATRSMSPRGGRWQMSYGGQTPAL